MQSSIRAVAVWLDRSSLPKVPGHEAGETNFRIRGRGDRRVGSIERGRCLWELRRSSRAWFLFDELAMDASDLAIQRAIEIISSSDPLIKLLDQVKMGRMKPTDAGLRAVTESWLATYQKSLETAGLTKQALRRIDPSPRLAVLTDRGVLAPDHPGVNALLASFERVVSSAME